MKALVRDLNNDRWEVAHISRYRRCVFFPFGDEKKWHAEAIPYDEFKMLEGTTEAVDPENHLTFKQINYKAWKLAESIRKRDARVRERRLKKELEKVSKRRSKC